MDPLLALHRALYVAYFERDVIEGVRRASRLRRWSLAQLERRSQHGGLLPLPQSEERDPRAIYARWVRPRRAVVLRGAARAWPAIAKWSFAYFAERYGDESIFVGEDTVERAAESTRYSLSVRELLLRDFVGEVSRGLPTYIKFVPFIERFPELLDDLRYDALDPLRGDQALRAPIGHEFYMGGRGSRTDLHAELSDILHVCLHGRKRWVLYPPEQWPYLYPVPAKTSFVASEVDALRARFETHPLARHAAGFEVVLEPGDVLYLPPYTWHAVENLEPSISVNHLWHTHLRSARAFPIAYFNCRVLMNQHMGTAEQFLTYFANRSLPNLHAL